MVDIVVPTHRSFERAMIEMVPRLQAYCRHRVNDAATAEDLAQEILLKAFRGSAALRDEARLEVWLYRIAWNGDGSLSAKTADRSMAR